MSVKYLGEQIDIHGGGQDLIFPHHENEIAQSESYTGKKPFVKYWMHNGLLQMGAEKMSKSLGNLITIRDALQKYGADALRVFILSSYYRSPLTYTEEAVEAAQGGAERLMRVALGESQESKGEALDAAPYRQRFIEAMDDDFNTPQALAALFDLARDINRAEENGMDVGKGREALKELGGVLGLTFKAKEEPPLEVEPLRKLAASFEEKVTGAGVIMPDVPDDANAIIDMLISVRKELRKSKQFQLADEIRSASSEIGILLEDTAQGTVWKRKR
jgi:cysteinyl-tRNA synthetase